MTERFVAASRTASTKRIDTPRLGASPLWRQPWIVSCWPKVTQLCATSCEPKPCEPESSRPLRRRRGRGPSRCCPRRPTGRSRSRTSEPCRWSSRRRCRTAASTCSPAERSRARRESAGPPEGPSARRRRARSTGTGKHSESCSREEQLARHGRPLSVCRWLASRGGVWTEPAAGATARLKAARGIGGAWIPCSTRGQTRTDPVVSCSVSRAA